MVGASPLQSNLPVHDWPMVVRLGIGAEFEKSKIADSRYRILDGKT